MKLKVFTAIACLTLSSACLYSLEASAQQMEVQMQMSDHSDMKYNVGKAIEILDTINLHEIQAANLALKKSSNPAVRNFAKVMKSEHGANLMQTKKIADRLNITPEPSDKSRKLQKVGKLELRKLSTLSGKEFDIAYADAMVKGHREALKIIDDKLLPNAKRPIVVNHLNDTRAVVKHHLRMAEKLQQQVEAQ